VQVTDQTAVEGELRARVGMAGTRRSLTTLLTFMKLRLVPHGNEDEIRESYRHRCLLTGPEKLVKGHTGRSGRKGGWARSKQLGELYFGSTV
jgi:hypothetical protein